jgi:hypothetical protein
MGDIFADEKFPWDFEWEVGWREFVGLYCIFHFG